MAIKLVNREWCACVNDFRHEYIVDSTADFENLPQCAAGSMAVAPSGEVKMVNASGEWVDFGG